MEIIKKYGEQIKKRTDLNRTKQSLSMIELGLQAEELRLKVMPDKQMPAAYRKLNQLVVREVKRALKNPKECAWTNLFAPVEILQSFHLNCMSMECIASFMGGFQIEDYFIDYAQNQGIASTLCSYHKNFIGLVESGVLPTPAYAVTTSMICDGNINTFRYLSQRNGMDVYYLDIPNDYSKEAQDYVKEQLQEMIACLEDETKQHFNKKELQKILQRENISKKYYKEFLQIQKKKYYPSTLTMHLFLLYATHLGIGSEAILQIFKEMKEEIKTTSDFDGTGIFWVHLLPYYQESIKGYMNENPMYQIQLCDFNVDYMEELDVENPLDALARKMLLNIYNGPFERKVQLVSELVDEMETDAVIDFCHWGCKQSSGGIALLKEEMNRKGIPTLILDGDALDKRNSHDGQIRTRLEAFLELIAQNKEGAADDRICV